MTKVLNVQTISLAKLFRFRWTALFMCALLVACNSVVEPVDNGYTVDTSANDTTVVGNDGDNNGVRDDLDKYIPTVIPEAARPTATIFARATQALLTAKDANTAESSLQSSSQALDCLQEQLGEKWFEVASDLENKTLNNEIRSRAYWKNQALAAGTTIKGSSGCDAVSPSSSRLPRIDQLPPSSCAYRVLFINGIMNTKSEARYSMVNIMQHIGPAYKGHAIQYDYLLNPSEKLANDLYEALKQKLAEKATFSWTAVNAAIKRILNPIGAAPSDVQELATFLGPTVKDSLLSFAKAEAGRMSDTTYDDDLVGTIAGKLITFVAKQPVVIVAHSQGNLYANAAWWKIKRVAPGVDASRIHIAAVATPANGVANGSTSDYITSSLDQIINLVRVAFPLTLPSNADATPNLDSDILLGHGFNTTYMNQLEASTVNLIRKQLDALEPKEKCAKIDPVTASVKPGQTQQFRATFDGFEPRNQPKTKWSVATGGGSIDINGLYTTPQTAGQYKVRAELVLNWFGKEFKPDPPVFADSMITVENFSGNIKIEMTVNEAGDLTYDVSSSANDINISGNKQQMSLNCSISGHRTSTNLNLIAVDTSSCSGSASASEYIKWYQDYTIPYQNYSIRNLNYGYGEYSSSTSDPNAKFFIFLYSDHTDSCIFNLINSCDC
jgi:hypothetical protein